MLFLILGIIGMTQEYRHRTATPTFLTEPRRGHVVVAKLIAYALVAVPFALVVVAVNVWSSSSTPERAARRRRSTPTTSRCSPPLGLVLVIYAVIGVGIGALMRNQVGAIVGGLVYLFVIEPMIRSIPATAGRLQVDARRRPGGHDRDLPGTRTARCLAGRLLLLGYGLVAAVLGTVLAVRRDVV